MAPLNAVPVIGTLVPDGSEPDLPDSEVIVGPRLVVNPSPPPWQRYSQVSASKPMVKAQEVGQPRGDRGRMDQRKVGAGVSAVGD